MHSSFCFLLPFFPCPFFAASCLGISISRFHGMEDLIALRDTNLRAHGSTDRPNHENHDSSLKKLQTFRARLKGFPDFPIDQFRSDICSSLNLSRYLSECASALLDAKFKPVEIINAVRIASFLHQNYTEFSQELVSYWNRKIHSSSGSEPTNTGAAGTAMQYECCKDEGDVLRKRALFRLYVDFLAAGVVTSEKILFAALRNELANNPNVELVAPLASGFAKYFFKLEPNPCRPELVSAIGQVVYFQFAQQRFLPIILAGLGSFREMVAATRSMWYSRGEVPADLREKWISSREKWEKWISILVPLLDKQSLVPKSLVPFLRAFATEAIPVDVSSSEGDDSQRDVILLLQGKFAETFQTAAAPQNPGQPTAPVPKSSESDDASVAQELLQAEEEDFPTWLLREDDIRLFYSGLNAPVAESENAPGLDATEEPVSKDPKDGCDPGSAAASASKVPKDKSLDYLIDNFASATTKSKIEEVLKNMRDLSLCQKDAAGFQSALRHKLLVRLQSNSYRIEAAPHLIRGVVRLDYFGICPDLLNSLISALTSSTEVSKVTRYRRLLCEILKCCLLLSVIDPAVSEKYSARGVSSFLLDRVATLIEEWTIASLEQLCFLMQACGRFLSRWPQSRVRCTTLAETMWRKKVARVLPLDVAMQVEQAYFATLPPKFTVQRQLEKERERKYGGAEFAVLACHPLVLYIEHIFQSASVIQNTSVGKDRNSRHTVASSEDFVLSKLKKVVWSDPDCVWMLHFTISHKIHFPSIPLLARSLARLCRESRPAAQFVVEVMDDLLFRVEYSSAWAPALFSVQRRSWDIAFLVECVSAGIIPPRTWMDLVLFLLRVPTSSTAAAASSNVKEDNIFRFRSAIYLLEPLLAKFDISNSWVELPVIALLLGSVPLFPLPVDLQISIDNISALLKSSKEKRGAPIQELNVAYLVGRVSECLDGLAFNYTGQLLMGRPVRKPSKKSTSAQTVPKLPPPVLKYNAKSILPFPKSDRPSDAFHGRPILISADWRKEEAVLAEMVERAVANAVPTGESKPGVGLSAASHTADTPPPAQPRPVAHPEDDDDDDEEEEEEPADEEEELEDDDDDAEEDVEDLEEDVEDLEDGLEDAEDDEDDEESSEEDDDEYDSDDSLADLENDEDDLDDIDRQIREITMESIRERREEGIVAPLALASAKTANAKTTVNATAPTEVKVLLKGKGTKVLQVSESDESSDLSQILKARQEAAKREQEERKRTLLQAYYTDEASQQEPQDVGRGFRGGKPARPWSRRR
eukprot:ANDGO_03548.mRNA.1 hypothetical protein